MPERVLILFFLICLILVRQVIGFIYYLFYIKLIIVRVINKILQKIILNIIITKKYLVKLFIL